MLPLLSRSQWSALDAYTIKNKPILGIHLMEYASQQCSDYILNRWGIHHPYYVLAGTGNNGGDALVIARALFHVGASVMTLVIGGGKMSDDRRSQWSRNKELGVPSVIIEDKNDMPTIPTGGIIIDGLFGVGLDRPVEGWLSELIHYVNQTNGIKVAIDIPSGVPADFTPFASGAAAIIADVTLTFQLPKMSSLLPLTGPYFGQVEVLNIGLMVEDFAASTNYLLVAPTDIDHIIKPRSKFDHKGKFGHALVIGGQKTMGGAIHLASKACVRSGAGLTSVWTDPSHVSILHQAIPEAMVCSWGEELDWARYNAVGIGPGLGVSEFSADLLDQTLQQIKTPMVIDADGLNVLTQHRDLVSHIPRDSILTPHPGEAQRLVGRWSSDQEKLELLSKFASEYQVYIVLKGAYSCTITPEGLIYFNPTGNPGMAKGGSGDTLTGIITALLVQGYCSRDAAILGVYIHGLAGDLAANSYGEVSMTPSDLIDHLGTAFMGSFQNAGN